jgi:hypothetical protein
VTPDLIGRNREWAHAAVDVSVHVDQSGCDDFPRRVDDDGSYIRRVLVDGASNPSAEIGLDGDDPPVLDADIAFLVRSARRIDDATTANDEIQ